MGEVQFARVFLSALDARPIKLTSDSIADQRQLPPSISYTLPKYPSSPAKRKRNADGTTGASSSNAPGVTIKLTYPKSAEHSVTLDNQPLTSSVFDLKSAYASTYHVAVDKIKLLYAKRPVADSKTLADVLGGDNAGGVAEFSVMLLGGAVPSASAPVAAGAAAETKPGAQEATRIPVGKELETEEFWTDLKGFLIQRLKDEGEGERLAQLFKKAAT